MNFNDLMGLCALLFIVLCGLYGLYRISTPVDYTREEYEKRLSKGSGIARGTMNALMYPLEELLHPKAVESIHVIKDVKHGHYDALQESGDGANDHLLVISDVGETAKSRHARTRIITFGSFLRRVLNVFRQPR